MGSLVARPLNVMYYIWGPYSNNTCDFIVFVGRALYICALGELTARQIIKFLYIFHFKHLINLNEDFVALFVTLVNLVFCGIFVFVSYYLGFHYSEIDFNICR